jgi:hypothetical protein
LTARLLQSHLSSLSLLSDSLDSHRLFQQPLTASFYIGHLLRCVDAKYKGVLGADEDIVLDPDAEIMESSGEVGMWRDEDAGFDGL